jgi:acetyl esterase/lipase
MKRSILGLLALALAVPLAAAAPRDFPTLEKPGTEDKYPLQITRWPGGVTSMADVTFSTINGYRPMMVDVYMPSKRGGPKPLVMYIHGGGWTGGTPRNSGAHANFPAALAKLASEGFVVASLEYRLADEARFPAQVQDARAALRFLKSNAATYGIDPSRTGVWGGSAGGHLASLTALSCGVTSLDPARGAKDVAPAPGSECVQAAVIWYGVFDFAALAAGRPGGSDGAGMRLLGCKDACTADQYAPASPVTYIDKTDPPHLLIHGVEDKVVPVAQSHLVEERFKAAGVPVESIYIPDVDHSFIGKTAADTHAATVKATNATFDFFHKTLGVQ